jgi:hypothetical protein
MARSVIGKNGERIRVGDHVHTSSGEWDRGVVVGFQILDGTEYAKIEDTTGMVTHVAPHHLTKVEAAA